MRIRRRDPDESHGTVMGHWMRAARLFDVSLAIAATACGSNTADVGVGGGLDAGEGGGDAVSSVEAGGSRDGASASDGSSAKADGPAPGSDGSADAGIASQDGARPDATAQDAAQDGAALQDVAPGDAAGTTMPVYVTFYGWADNSPAGNAIAYPSGGGSPTLHGGAGGTGTYADPITFATDPTEFPPGTRLYVPFIDKYVMMEDSCGQCATDWTTRKWHIDIWMNSNASENASALIGCENSWTRTQTDVELTPPPARTVTTAPLFDPSSNVCRTTP
jgi:3D (Asp-Asp-Asp) domain-containing protein